MSVYYELAGHAAAVVEAVSSGDDYTASARSRAMKDTVKRMDDKQPYSPFHLSLIFSSLLKLPIETEEDVNLQLEIALRIKDIYGENHIVLGDLYYQLADLLGRKRHFARSLELSGQALLIRVNRYGILHEKTAESHLALGLLYRYLGSFEKSRQELFICRGIRSKLHGEASTAVAHCDLYIGHTELALSNSITPGVATNGTLSSGGFGAQRNQKARGSAVAAYVSFYRSFHCRYLELGPIDPLTIEAQELVMRHSLVGGERLVSAMELKLRIQELQWSCSSTNNWLYSVALFVGRLGADEALTLLQLRQLVTSAIRFSVSRLGATQSGSRNSSPIKERPGTFSPNSSFRNPVRSRLDEPSSEGETELEDGELLSGADPEQEQINVITSMLMMIPKPFVSGGLTPGKRSNPSSPNPAKLSQATDAKDSKAALPKLRIPGMNSASNSALNSPDANDRPTPPAAWQLRQSIKRGEAPSGSGDVADDESKVAVEGLEEAMGEVVIVDDEEGAAAATPQSQSHSESSSSKFQSKLKTIGADEGVSSPGKAGNAGNAVLARSLPATWKPIRSAYHSLAWSATQVIQKIDFALGTAERIYARDSEGVLLVLRRAAGNTIDEAEANEKKALRKSVRKSTTAATGGAESKRKSIAGKTTEASATAGEKPGGDDAKAKLNALFGKRAPPPETKAEEDVTDPRAKLNALFSKPGGGGLKLGGPPSTGPASSGGGGAGGGAAKAGGGPVWGTDIPFPPPVPTSWPPEPYTADAAEGAVTTESAGDVAMTTSTIVNADGTVVTIATPVPAGPPKPKLKQIYLVSLPSIEGTMWADEGEALISPEELFDDLEAEFTLEKPKVKKFNEVPFGGGPGGAGGGAGGAGGKGAGLGGGKKGHGDEAVLDAQRAQNLNIMLAKFGKKSLFDLAQSVKWFEAEIVGASAVSSLSAFVPTADECAKVTAFVLKKHAHQAHQLEEQKRKEKEQFEKNGGGAASTEDAASAPSEDTSKTKGKAAKLPTVPASAVDERALAKLKLGKAEQFVFVFAQVPKLEIRLSAMTSALSVKETSANILSSAETILNAVNEVRGSGRLKFLLKAFLDLNNALNKAAKAQDKLIGIKLESLAKITQTKSNSGETVEQYVVNKVLQHFPDALKVGTDMPSIEAAKAVLFPRLVADLRKLEDGISMMKSLIEFDAPKEKVAEKIAEEKHAEFNSGSKASTAESAGDVSKPPPPPPPPSVSSSAPTPTSTLSTAATVEGDKSQIHKYLQHSETVFAKATKQLTDAQRDFAELCTYFGEEAPGDPDKLFGQIITFVRGIAAATVVAEAKQKKKDKPQAPMGRPQIKLPNMIH